MYKPENIHFIHKIHFKRVIPVTPDLLAFTKTDHL